MNTSEFNFTYSAKEQSEIKKIREKYLEPETSEEEVSLDALRKIDASVTGKASAASLAVGILSTLIMGFGMSLVMSNLRNVFFKEYSMSIAVGTAVGLIGIAGIICAYPLHKAILKKERKKIAPEILRLSEKLIK